MKLCLYALIVFEALLAQPKDTCDAQETWRRALQVRGLDGIEIETLAITGNSSWRLGLRRMRASGVGVYGPRGKGWSWSDMGMGDKGIFPRHATLFDLDNGSTTSQFVGRDSSTRREDVEGYFVPLLAVLPTSKWVKPEVNQCSVEPDAIVLQGTWRSFVIRYRLDPNTMLPFTFEYDGGKALVRHRMKDYRSVQGILFPHKELVVQRAIPSHWNERTYEVNPKVNPAIFTDPPNPEAGPDQWRLK
jgi:hypothetical protein